MPGNFGRWDNAARLVRAVPEPRRVLLVDDEDMVRTTLGMVIQRFGYSVTATAGEDEAVTALAAEDFDVLVTDLNLGEGGDGWTVVRHAKTHMPQMPVIVLTGYPSPANAMVAHRLRVFRYFTKPCPVAELQSALLEATTNQPPVI